MIGIYKITNQINGKVYIGQSIDIEARWLRHRRDSKIENSLLYRAMRKYGIENFTFEVVEECSIEELDYKEEFYIEKYRSYIGYEDCNGYNMTLGGGGVRGKIFTDEEIEKIRKSKIGEKNPMFGLRGGASHFSKRVFCDGLVFESVVECANFYDFDYAKMKAYLIGKCKMPKKWLDKNLHYIIENKEEQKTYEEKLKSINSKEDKRRKKVHCEGKIFNSARECAKFYDINSSTLTNYLNGKNKMPKEWVDKKLHYVSE